MPKLLTIINKMKKDQSPQSHHARPTETGRLKQTDWNTPTETGRLKHADWYKQIDKSRLKHADWNMRTETVRLKQADCNMLTETSGLKVADWNRLTETGRLKLAVWNWRSCETCWLKRADWNWRIETEWAFLPSAKTRDSMIGWGGGSCGDRSFFHFIIYGEQFGRDQVYCTLWSDGAR
jgi:hypothetical protein